jgi:protein-glutamine gamma-glutamyltransferase
VPRPLTGLTRWRMRSSPPRSFDPQLSPMLRQAALRLPAGFNPRSIALARQWRAEAGDDDAAVVRRALDLINRDFAYSLGAPPAGRHAVDEFLFETRLGFCQHFSSAFAVLMRAAGVPTRVVTGYAGGYRNPIGGYWLVRRSDAHAWNEVWLEGRGWVRVDPTAAVAPERIYDTIDDRRPGAEGLLGALGAGPAFDLADWMRRGWNDFVLGFDAARQRRMLQPLGLDATPARLAALFAGVAVVALLLTWWLVARDERERDPVLRAWHRLGRRYARQGLARLPHEPPLAWVRRVAAARPDRVSELNALSLRFAEWRYAAHAGDARAARRLARDLRAHRP